MIASLLVAVAIKVPHSPYATRQFSFWRAGWDVRVEKGRIDTGKVLRVGRDGNVYRGEQFAFWTDGTPHGVAITGVPGSVQRSLGFGRAALLG